MLDSTATVATPECNPVTLASVTATTGMTNKNSSQDDLLPTSGVPKAKVLKIEEISDTSALQWVGILLFDNHLNGNNSIDSTDKTDKYWKLIVLIRLLVVFFPITFWTIQL